MNYKCQHLLHHQPPPHTPRGQMASSALTWEQVTLVRSRHAHLFLFRAKGPFTLFFLSFLAGELYFSLTQQGPSTHRWPIYISNKRAGTQLPGIIDFRTWQGQPQTTYSCVLSAAERRGDQPSPHR